MPRSTGTTRRGAYKVMLGAILGALPLVGCALQPEPVPPVRIGPDGFREASGAPVAWPDPGWWRGFGSPELNRLMERMAAENLDLAAATARVRQADASARVAGAALLPQVNLNADTQRNRTGFSGGRSITSYAANLSASYEIDFWGLNRNAANAARLSATAQRFDLVTTLLTSEASVANTYFTILEARNALAIQEENLRAARRVLAVIRQQVAAGTATGLDLAQQETVVAQQEAAVPPLRQTVSQNAASLAVLLGLAPAELDLLGESLEGLDVPYPEVGLPSELLARRPDVQAAEASLAAANANVASARAALYPSIVLNGQYGASSVLLGTLLRPEQQFYSIAAGLVQTVFDGGALRGRVDLARGQAEELLVGYRQAILSALSDVEGSLTALRETTEQERLLRDAEEKANRAYTIAEGQLRGGIINLITLLNTQTALFTARRNLSRGRLLRFQAAVGLFRALGGGWGPGVLSAVMEAGR